jgi:CheY-like chemotaxis protein/glycine cleavage system H lipoate-binding protein
MEQKLNLLVIDDEQVVLDSIRKLLKNENYNIYTVLTSQEALDLLKDRDIDIILTDLMLPEMDGLELLDAVKKIIPHLPMIVITGHATINTALQATHLGAFDYIAKPFTKSELLGVLKRANKMAETSKAAEKKGSVPLGKEQQKSKKPITSLGQNSWMMMEEDGLVILGAQLAFLKEIGDIQHVYLPSVGDEIRQGSVYSQITTSDIKTHTLNCPLSGTVTDVNKKIEETPKILLNDTYGEGWLIRIKPSRFEFEIKTLGL